MKLQAILALLCALAAAAAYHFTPRTMLADIKPVHLETMIPKEFGDWRLIPESMELISSPERDAVVKSVYTQVLNRTYSDSQGNLVMLSVAYTRNQSDNSGTQSHKPDICYPAQGFSILKREKANISYHNQTIPVVKLVTKNGDRVEPLMYWIMIGEHASTSMIDIKAAQIMYGFNNVIPDGMIFRVSTIDDNKDKSFEQQNKFILSLINLLPKEPLLRLSGMHKGSSISK